MKELKTAGVRLPDSPLVPYPSRSLVPERDVRYTPVLEASRLGIDFGGLTAVDDFTLTIGRTEIAGLIGPNGAGKTTVFNLLTSVYQPTRGSILINGMPTAGKSTHQVSRMGIARTFQNIRLYNDMSVIDNVKVGMHNSVRENLLAAVTHGFGYRKAERQAEATALEMLDFFGMADLAHAQAGSLPYGAQRRLEIVRALASGPLLLAWDGNGNSTMKVYTVTYHQISEGDPAGSVDVVLDATTIGLGILDTGTLDIVEGETAASVLLRFLQERGYEPDYQGSTTMNFYLRRISRGDIAYRANVPEHLWELILRDGITTNDNYDRDSIGEFDYTQGSGWMYSINGTLYEGTGMSGYKVRNGITIYVRFTLSYGKDIGGYDSTGGGYGSLSSYCGLWINGGYQALGHDFVETDRLEPTETEDGYIHYRCSKCHEEKTDILLATGGTEPSPTAAQAAPALLLRRGSGLTPYQNKFHRTWEAAA